MTWFWPFDSFDPLPVVLLQLKMWERKNWTVTVIFDPASVTAEFAVWIHRNYGETVGVNRSGMLMICSRWNTAYWHQTRKWSAPKYWPLHGFGQVIDLLHLDPLNTWQSRQKSSSIHLCLISKNILCASLLLLCMYPLIGLSLNLM